MENKTGMKVAKKYEEAVELIEKDDEGVWIYLKDGHYFPDTETHIIREDNQKEAYKQLQTIIPCDCKNCQKSAAAEEESAEEEAAEEEETENLQGVKVYETKLNVYGGLENVTIEFMNDSANSIIMTLHGDEDEMYAGIIDGQVVDFGNLYEYDVYRLEVLRKASEFITGTVL